MLERYRAAGLTLTAAHVFTAFGCHHEGAVSPAQAVAALRDLLTVCAEHGQQPQVIYLCDTVGAANPESVRAVLDLARTRWPEREFALHLHDTRGIGPGQCASLPSARRAPFRHLDRRLGRLPICRQQVGCWKHLHRRRGADVRGDGARNESGPGGAGGLRPFGRTNCRPSAAGEIHGGGALEPEILSERVEGGPHLEGKLAGAIHPACG